ncbi:hypothetical protein B0H19DRAFT_1068937 [Mycena capillaripes]|nr:hypothetical protein B0H19DRAFT_1068937 [Mycena capillaripes]
MLTGGNKLTLCSGPDLGGKGFKEIFVVYNVALGCSGIFKEKSAITRQLIQSVVSKRGALAFHRVPLSPGTPGITLWKAGGPRSETDDDISPGMIAEVMPVIHAVPAIGTKLNIPRDVELKDIKELEKDGGKSGWTLRLP